MRSSLHTSIIGHPIIVRLLLFFKSPKFSQYFFNTVWMFADKIVSIIVAIVVGIWVARYLGPKDFGRLNYATSVIAFFVPFATLGMNRVLIKEVVQSPDQRDNLLGTAFMLRGISSVSSVLIILFLVINVEREPIIQQMLFIVGLGILFQPFTTLYDYFLSQVQAKYISLTNVFSKLVVAIMRVVLIVGSFNVFFFALAVLYENIIRFIGYSIGFWKNGLTFRSWRFRKSTANSLFLASLPLIFANFSYILYQRVDQVMLQKMLGSYAVGIFSASVRIYEPLVGLVAIIGSSLYPQFVNLYGTNQTKYWLFYEIISTIMAFIGWCLVVVMAIFGGKIIIGLFGEEYSPTAQILIYHMVSATIMFTCVLRAGHINIVNANWVLMITTFSSAVLNIGLNYIFIRNIGVVGAALASVITQIISLIVLDLFFLPTRKLFAVSLRTFLVFPSIVNVTNKYLRKNE